MAPKPAIFILLNSCSSGAVAISSTADWPSLGIGFRPEVTSSSSIGLPCPPWRHGRGVNGRGGLIGLDQEDLDRRGEIEADQETEAKAATQTISRPRSSIR
jgi:hypothetical protein